MSGEARIPVEAAPPESPPGSAPPFLAEDVALFRSLWRRVIFLFKKGEHGRKSGPGQDGFCGKRAVGEEARVRRDQCAEMTVLLKNFAGVGLHECLYSSWLCKQLFFSPLLLPLTPFC